ncbi:MAG: T9SS type A sorting domain-containing protein [Bacteroidetes bacterium]|nr:T9SS type A sorting domain-containing protein [Bacteroidota bacterium]
MFPSIRYTGRLAGDPLGQMTIAEKGITNGGGSQTNTDGRWGDYSAMSADPSEVGKFWYTQEYYSTTSNSSWKTRIASFSFGNIFSTVTTAAPNPVCAGDSTQLNVNAYGGSGIYTFSWSSIPAGFTSTLQSPKAAPMDTIKYIAVTSDGTLTRSDTIKVNVQHKPVISAGADTTVCWYVITVDVHGTASNYKVIGWTTTGTGTFTNASSLNTVYNPTLADKIAGSVDLNLVAIPNLPCSGNVISSKHVVFDVCTGINGQPSDTPALLLQPNPAHSSVAITTSGISGSQADLSIKSLDGKVVYSENVTLTGKPSVTNLSLSGYANGIYIVQLKTGQQVITQKLIVQ